MCLQILQSLQGSEDGTEAEEAITVDPVLCDVWITEFLKNAWYT